MTVIDSLGKVAGGIVADSSFFTPRAPCCVNPALVLELEGAG